jgi:hypothetical protein
MLLPLRKQVENLLSRKYDNHRIFHRVKDSPHTHRMAFSAIVTRGLAKFAEKLVFF